MTPSNVSSARDPPPSKLVVAFDMDDDSSHVVSERGIKDPTNTHDVEQGSEASCSSCSSYVADSNGMDDSKIYQDDDGLEADNGDEDNAMPKTPFSKLPIGLKTQTMRLALVSLYCLQGFGITLLVFFLADALEDEMGSIFLPPWVFAFIVASVFVLVGSLGYYYHSFLVQQLQKLDTTAKESQALVSSFFPAQFRERLLRERVDAKESTSSPITSTDNSLATPTNPSITPLPKTQLKSFLDNDNGRGGPKTCPTKSKPIADLFPNCTVLFADISGFTAWSSEREPTQVFLLLESLYQQFDRIARRLGVFKVETIGDCYLAVTGLPDPQEDHAVRMVKFARNIVKEMVAVVKQLERILGPDTCELRLRCGIHSGPVTAGVLRGDKSRFQLFGDTVNTASRLETTSERNRIQMSQSTADLLIQDGKENWIKLRHDLVSAKGKGDLQTFWAVNRTTRNASERSITSHSGSLASPGSSDKHDSQSIGWGGSDTEDNFVLALPPMSRSAKNKRLIDWLVEILTQQLKRIVAQRHPDLTGQRVEDPKAALQKSGETPYDEVVESLHLPKCGGASVFCDSNAVVLGDDVVPQLRALVTQIANRYKDNPFHNFEHASHVTMSVHKLLNRVVTPDEVDYERDSLDAIGIDVHNYTYGLTSDALSQFAIVFSALIHDVDHSGVSNGRLAEENPDLGDKYKHKSIAEQNSVDLAWELLLQDEYKDLQQCIFANEEELHRFRSTIVNSVLATDIFEKDSKAFRNQRWEKAFHSAAKGMGRDEEHAPAVDDDASSNLKATIVIEHIIQASDVSHTMQHWSVYQKWNERLFREMYLAFDEGRMEKAPSEGWYKGELWFFDNYVIPLAKKLAECKVFGVSSDEYLTYAIDNRKEWAQKGERVVQEMTERYQKRKELEIAGLTNDEINSFTPQDLEFIMKKLIEKGRQNGTKRVDAAKGQNDAAQAWMDALEIYERAPATSEMKDTTLIFPVYSGIHGWLKFGKIMNDKDGHFEMNLARKFVRESKHYSKHSVHYMRAMAMLCEVTAFYGNYPTALKLLESLQSVYDAEEYSLASEKVYGVDRAAVAIAQSAMWFDQMGNDEKALAVCDHVTTELLPLLDPTNTLGIFEVLVPVLKVLKQNGYGKRCHDLFKKHVHEAFLENHGPDAFTPTKPLHKPMVWMFGMIHDPDGFADFEEVVEFLAEGDNGIPNGVLDSIIIRSVWGPTDMAAELCLLVAKRLVRENRQEEEACKKIAEKGLRLARMAEDKIKNINGRVVLHYAYKVHAPVLAELEDLAKTLGTFTEAPPRTEMTPGVQVNLPPSYLLLPNDAEEYI